MKQLLETGRSYKIEGFISPKSGKVFQSYLKLENYEGVNYWQSRQTPSAINITPALPDVDGTHNGEQFAGAPVSEDYVVGVMYDTDALMVDYQLDDASATPKEARKHYHNLWWTFAKNAIVDSTENMVVFVMR